jgi:hypothetical protein
MFRFLRSLQMFFQLAFPPAVYEGSFFPTSLPTPVVGGVFDDGYSNRSTNLLRDFIDASISFLVIDLFRCFIASWFNFGWSYVSRNLFISS